MKRNLHLLMMHIQDIEQHESPRRIEIRLLLKAIEIDYARDIATLKPQQQFMQQWRDFIPTIVHGLTESEYLVFETMFEMFADLRESASYPSMPMPTVEYTFERSRKIRRVKRSERFDK